MPKLVMVEAPKPAKAKPAKATPAAGKPAAKAASKAPAKTPQTNASVKTAWVDGKKKA
jgi:hypothetical protein